MGYFSNATEHLYYEESVCKHCRHHDLETGCPVMDAHQLYNYDECSNPESILHMLIPRTDAANERCAMFIAQDDNRCEQTPDMFDHIGGEA